MCCRIGSDSPNHEAIKIGKDVKGIWVDPVLHLVIGEIKDAAEKNCMSSIRIPGYWIDKHGLEHVRPGAAPASGEKVTYCLHGGTYITRSAHPSDYTANIPCGILKHCQTVTHSFSIEYQLSRAAPLEPMGAFPSALIDALTGYNCWNYCELSEAEITLSLFGT
jgi:hypothetical protein